MKYLIVFILFFNVLAVHVFGQKSSNSLSNHEMVTVDGGTFQMLNKTNESKEKLYHSVTLNSYSIGKYEVSQAQWKALMVSNPSYHKDCDQCPVENVSWNEIQEFIQKLNAQTGKNYRLPTEAEWEFAAKGGNNSKGYIYSGSNDLSAVAWHSDNSDYKAQIIGGKQANELGIYDMSGNVWEWCSDWFGELSSSNETNPKGSLSGETRVLRGGGWDYWVNYCSVSGRHSAFPSDRIPFYGFRLVLPLDR